MDTSPLPLTDPHAEPGEPGQAAELSFPDMLLRALCEAPGTGFDLARRLERTWPGFLRQKEGFVYPALLELWREGHVESAWRETARGRRRVYRLAGTRDRPPPDEAGVDGGEADGGTPLLDHARENPVERDLERAAGRCAAGLRFAPRLREETRLEIRLHLLDGRHAYAGMGVPDEEAVSRSIRDLGDVWRIRTDLRRAARGQRVVAFPRTLYEGLLGIAIYDLRVLLLIMATMLFVRVQVVTAYHIPTKSMEPTLHGDREDGDHILVNKLAGPPERFDIVVFDGWGAERKHYVKRVAGLPGESILLREGDLYVNDELVRKEGAAYEALLFPVFDLGDEKRLAASGGDRTASGGPTARDVFESRLTDLWAVPSRSPPWSLDRATGEFLADVPEQGRHAAEFEWGSPVEDSVYDPATCDDAEVGLYDVADQRITVAVRPRDEACRVALRLTRGDRVYEAVVRGDTPGVSLRVDGEEVARDDGIAVPVGAATEVRFAAVDHVLRLDVAGETVLRHDLPAPGNPRRTGPICVAGVLVGAGRAGITPLRLERDVYWTADREEIRARDPGEGEYFVLGDNSNNSQDSRTRGPIHGSRIVGKPLLVVWPFTRLRIPR